MVRLEGLKSEALRAERVGVIWEVMLPSPSASLVALGSAVGSGEKPRQPRDLERFIGLQSRSWC